MHSHVIDRRSLQRDPATEGALDETGRLRVLDAAFWRGFSQNEIGAFCVAHGFYCIPTTELVEWLRERVVGKRAIEIGSGSGVLAEAVGLRATDNHMQTWPHIAALYGALGQATVAYGPAVEKLDAEAAMVRYKPKLVVAAWVTHRWDQRAPQREGNMYGVKEERIVAKATYIHIGNRAVHRNKPILDRPHKEYEFPWLVSRAMNGSPNFIAVWEKK